MGSIIVYVVVCAFAAYLVSKYEYSSRITISAVMGLTILVLFAAGRYHVGTDCNTYTHIFERYAAMPWNAFLASLDSEILFGIVAKATYSLGGRVLTWGTFATLTAVPTYFALKKEYEEICLGVAFFVFCISFYTTAFNVTRQFVAVAFVFWGIQFVYKNKLIPFLLTVLVATGFHTSAIIALFIWFMWDHKQGGALKGTKRFVLIVAVAIIAYFYQNVISMLTSTFSNMESYSGYAETSLRGQNRDLYVSIFECIVIYLIGSRQIRENEKLDFMFTLLLVSTLIGFTGFWHPQVKRIAYYFNLPSSLVLSGYLPYSFSVNSKALSKAIICFYYAALFVLTAYILNQANLIPYRFDLFSPW